MRFCVKAYRCWGSECPTSSLSSRTEVDGTLSTAVRDPQCWLPRHWGLFVLACETCDPTDVFCALKDGQFGFFDALDARHQVFQPETQMLPYLCKDTQEIKQ